MAAIYQHRTFQFDQRLQLPNNFLFCGSTQSGKTHLLLSWLKNADKIFNPKPEKVIMFYAAFQDCYTDTQQHLHKELGIEMLLIKAAETSLEDLISLADKKETLVIFDDATLETSSSNMIAKAFMHLRHEHISMVLLQHTLFPRTRQSALISGNTKYYILLSSIRMRSQIVCLGAQIHMSKLLKEAYADATEKLGPYGYLLLDMTSSTPDFLRVRTRILDPVSYVYVPKM